MKTIVGGTPYAIGRVFRGMFSVRCIRFGKLAASHEKYGDEEIRTVVELSVAEKSSRPCSVHLRNLV